MKLMAIAGLFHLLDLVSGVISALRTGKVNSSKLRDGLFKKVGFFIVYICCFLVDTYKYDIGLKLNFKVLPIVISYCVLTEIVSILENVAIFNPAIVPQKILKLLKVGEDINEPF